LWAAPTLAAWPALALEPAPALLTYERAVGGRVGFYAENVASGSRLSWRADEPFVMCSTFKASLAAFVLTRVDAGQERLEAMVPFGPADIVEDGWAPVARANLAKGALSVDELCAAAVEESDNTCANLLLARVGGPLALTRFWRALGDPVTRLDHNEPLLNRSAPFDPHDATAPRAMAGSLGRFLLGPVLSSGSRARVTGWMLNCKTGARRLRAGLPGHWRVGDKTGGNGKDAAGDIAIAWPKSGGPVLIAAYAQGGAPTAGQLDAVIAEIGRIVGERLG
jgi:beta-lactamase class A